MLMNFTIAVGRGLALTISMCGVILAQGTSSSQGQSSGQGESLEKAVVDPTASLMSFNFRDIVTPNYYGRSGSANQIQFQPAIPFVAWGRANILRVTLPFNTGGVPGKGLGSVQVFSITVLPMKGGRFGVGPVMNIVSNPALTTDRIQAGPALGYVASKGKWTYGMFNQNLFSGDTQITALQPLVAYQLGNGWALAAGDAQWTIDWDRGEFVNVPLGIQIGKISKLGGQLVRYVFNPEYNAVSVTGTPHWTLRFGIQLLVPGR